MPNSSGKKFVITTLVLIAILVSAFLFLQHKKTKPFPAPVTIKTSNQPSISNPEAKLHFVAFEDLKCVNCKRYNMTLYPQIKKMFIDTKKATYTIIPLSFLHHSTPAANTALCLYKQNPDYFFNFVDYVFLHQPDEASDWATPNTLLQFASHATPKANMTALSQCMISNRYGKQLSDNLALASSVIKPHVSTPSLFVNGILIRPLTMKRITEVIAHVNDH